MKTAAHPHRSPMRCRAPGLLATLLMLGAGCGAWAAPLADDPLNSAECRHAIAAVKAQEKLLTDSVVAASGPAAAASADSGKGLRSQLKTLRTVAAKACLGTAADPDARPATRNQSVPERPLAPIAVTPMRVAPPLQPIVPVPPHSSPAPLARPEPLRSITSCDAAGCWASDGSRLQRMGPGLVGPKGFCTVQGAIVNCP